MVLITEHFPWEEAASECPGGSPVNAGASTAPHQPGPTGRDACGKTARALPPHRSEHPCILGCDVFQVIGPKTMAPPVEGPPVLALVGLKARLPPPSVCLSPLRVDSQVGLVGSGHPSQLMATRCFPSFLGEFGHEGAVQTRVLGVDLAAVTPTCHPALFPRSPDPAGSAR